MSSEIYSLPPEGRGTPEQQLIEMRDFLVRTVRQLNAANDAAGNGKTVVTAANRSAVIKSNAETTDDITIIRRQAAALRDLITKTSDQVYSYVDRITTELESVYVSRSDFGEYTETVSTTIEQTARETVESYNYDSRIQDAINANAATQTYVENIQGEIRRGFITVNGTTYFGIAIGDKLRFTAQTRTEGGETYYELVTGQNLGLYTASGWYFFLDGVPAGWFSSGDGMLHVANINVEETLQMGVWMFTTSGGFGIRYIGG